MDIDLSQLIVKEGEKILTLNGVIGDIFVTLPRTLKVAVKANAIIGDIKILDVTAEGLFINRTYKSEGYEAAKKKLYIAASQVIGDIQIKRANS